ncbi:Zn-dependent alcohol dehydrogenase [Immundisolibacter sp.]|uniref:Zn-dependent alcohol dehydrogenase n=1 Tax=Immundisolibacter sp. TaxID=1934948 RepID=UPI0025B806E8|nr:Zn-dependent alcohol dehydrogenase [Immundisolibacter sp.]
MLSMKAVVVRDHNQYAVETVNLDPPKTGEVLVRIKACGVCHSDISIINGTIPQPFPAVIGHEGAGIVEQIGEGVRTVKPGDHVVMSFVPRCGECFHCLHDQPFLCTVSPPDGTLFDGTSRIHQDGKRFYTMSFLGNMAEYAVVPEACVVSVDKSVPFRAAALVGCGVTTGVGAVINTAQVQPGSTVAVFGCGGVGLSVIQGARIAGARMVIAVDLSREKLEMAKGFGATHTVEPGSDPVKEIMGLTGGIGADYAFEVVGIGKLVETAFKATRRGGMTVVVGVGSKDDRYSFNALILPFTAKTVKGSMYGSANFKVDFPMLLDLYKAGKLDLDHMVTRTYTIDEAGQAFADLEAGRNARGVIVFG